MIKMYSMMGVWWILWLFASLFFSTPTEALLAPGATHLSAVSGMPKTRASNKHATPFGVLLQSTKKAVAMPPNLAYPDPPLPNFCANCGSSHMTIRVPPNDERPRACCDDCNAVVYVNPKVVVATVVLMATDGSNDPASLQCLLAKRAIEPRLGYWGIPQGFMELGETSRQAAVREVYEETGAVLDAQSLQLRAVYNVPGSVQLVYQALVVGAKDDVPIADATTESTEIGFFDVQQLPDLCFPTVQWAIDHCVAATATQAESATDSINYPIQQKTKFYDATTATWSEYEDEAV